MIQAVMDKATRREFNKIRRELKSCVTLFKHSEVRKQVSRQLNVAMQKTQKRLEAEAKPAAKSTQSGATTANNSAPCFLGLPPEIRNRIYEFVLFSHGNHFFRISDGVRLEAIGCCPHHTPTTALATVPAIAQVCQQTRQETLSTFFHDGTFVCDLRNPETWHGDTLQEFCINCGSSDCSEMFEDEGNTEWDLLGNVNFVAMSRLLDWVAYNKVEQFDYLDLILLIPDSVEEEATECNSEVDIVVRIFFRESPDTTSVLATIRSTGVLDDEMGEALVSDSQTCLPEWVFNVHDVNLVEAPGVAGHCGYLEAQFERVFEAREAGDGEPEFTFRIALQRFLSHRFPHLEH